MKTLEAEFEKSNGRKQYLRLKDFDTTKSAEEIKASLNKLTKLTLFEKDGVGLFKKLRHAKLIEKIETTIFDDSQSSAKKAVVEIAPEKPSTQEKTPVQMIKELQNVRIPEDLKITMEIPEPGSLIQRVRLPDGINLRKMTESQAMTVITACLPDDYTLENVQIEDNEEPATLVLTERLKEGRAEPPEITTSPPEAKRKRWRLLDRIRKRE